MSQFTVEKLPSQNALCFIIKNIVYAEKNGKLALVYQHHITYKRNTIKHL